MRSKGEECHLEAECAAELYCDLWNVCPGTCKRRLRLGEDCRAGGPCEAGSRCLAFDSWDPNSNHRCVFEGGEGEPCDPLCRSDSDSCTFGGFCEGPDLCNPETLTCTAPHQLGESCGTMEEFPVYIACSGPSFCSRKGQSGLGLCLARSELGGPCHYAGGDDCKPGLLCQAEIYPIVPTPTGVCIAAPEVGEPCASFGGVGHCAAGLNCVDGTCDGLRAEGQSCSLPSLCAAEYWCVESVRVSAAYVGDLCVIDELGQGTCRWGSCVDGICQAPAQLVRARSDSRDCASGAECEDAICVYREGCGSLNF